MENFFTADNGRIYYKDQGKGEIIVLLHGYLETSEIWDSFAGKLAGKYRVVSIDLPGHGKSDVFGEIHSMEFMASVIKELMAGSGDGNFFLAGHSLGGYVTMAFVDLFPQLLKGYCLFHSGRNAKEKGT